MICVMSFGRGLRINFGNKVVWWLYLLGAFAGGLSMNFGMPNSPIVVPQVGADSPIAAFLTFYGMFNMHSHVLIFLFPVRIWVNIEFYVGTFSFYGNLFTF